jgi:tripartite-type tricarboxylate transporter receptor subunit TctC
MTGTRMLHVPYKGSAPANTDLLANRIQLMFDAGASVLPHVQAGTLRLLAVTSAQRFAPWPQTPTVAEAGVPGYQIDTWFGLVAPAGTPDAIREKLGTEIAAVMTDAALNARFLALGVVLTHSSPAEFEALIARETTKWGAVMTAANVMPE